MENQRKNDTALEENDKNKKSWIGPVIAGIIFLLAMIYLLNLFSAWDKNDPSKWGDTFNGVVGPFISLLSAILIYLAFQKQVEANKFVSNQILERKNELQIENIKFMFEEFKSIFDNYSYTWISETSYKNIAMQNTAAKFRSDMMDIFNNNGNDVSSNTHLKIKHLLIIFSNLISSIDSIESKSLAKQKRSLQLMARFFYESELEACLHKWVLEMASFKVESAFDEYYQGVIKALDTAAQKKSLTEVDVSDRKRNFELRSTYRRPLVITNVSNFFDEMTNSINTIEEAMKRWYPNLLQ